MEQFCASAPGKILWLGGYSVLERGNAAYVASIDKRAYAQASLLEGNALEIKAPQFGIDLFGTIRNGKPSFKSVPRKKLESARFLVAAVSISLKYLHSKGGGKAHGFRLIAVNDPVFGRAGFKTGLGSSSAVTVAAIGAVLGLNGCDPSYEKCKVVAHNLSQLAHSQAQGKIGSGFDVASGVFGPISYSRPSRDAIQKAGKSAGKRFAEVVEKAWDYKIAFLAPPKEFAIALAFTGKPSSTTRMIAKLNAFKARRKSTYSEMVREIDGANVMAIGSLERILALRNKDLEEYMLEMRRGHGPGEAFKAAFEEARLLTKKLGELAGAEIENASMTRLIHSTMQNGAYVCRLPGAGGGDSVAAICLSENEARRVRNYWKSLKLEVLDVSLGNEGVRREAPLAFEGMLKRWL
ncbi:MAG: hypothetical protein ABH863_01195 [Candidatus Micrarchaeota archaeon]